jgi:hypothetical protein
MLCNRKYINKEHKNVEFHHPKRLSSFDLHFTHLIPVKKLVKFSLEQATKAQRGVEV